jgi:hypothetical protein
MRKYLWCGSVLGGSIAVSALFAVSYFGSHPSALVARCSGLLPEVLGQAPDDADVECGVEMCAPDEPCPVNMLPDQPEPIVVYRNGVGAGEPADGTPAGLSDEEAASRAELPATEFDEECYRTMPPCAEEEPELPLVMPYATEADTLRALGGLWMGLTFGPPARSGGAEEAEPVSPQPACPCAGSAPCPGCCPHARETPSNAGRSASGARGAASRSEAQEPEAIRARLDEILRQHRPESGPPRLHLDTLEFRPSDSKGSKAGPIPF